MFVAFQETFPVNLRLHLVFADRRATARTTTFVEPCSIQTKKRLDDSCFCGEFEFFDDVSVFQVDLACQTKRCFCDCASCFHAQHAFSQEILRAKRREQVVQSWLAGESWCCGNSHCCAAVEGL